MAEPTLSSDDPCDGLGLWCELHLGSEGTVWVTRGRWCTPEDAMDLCRLVVTGDSVVRDLTDANDLDPDHPSYSWLRSGS